MLLKILSGIFLVIFYILWLPIAIFKDIALILYIPFDIERFLKTYQGFMTNLYTFNNFNREIENNSNEIGLVKDSLNYKKTEMGFGTQERLEEN